MHRAEEVWRFLLPAARLPPLHALKPRSKGGLRLSAARQLQKANAPAADLEEKRFRHLQQAAPL